MSKTDFAGAVKAKLASITGTTTDMGKLTALIISVGKRAHNLDIDMHAAAVGCIRATYEHGDCTIAAKLCNSLGKHTRAKALAEWFERYSDIVLVLKKDVWAAKLVDKDLRRTKDELQLLAAAALTDPFWTVPEKASRDFSLAAAIAQLLKKASADKAKAAMTDDERVALAELTAIGERFKPVEQGDGGSSFAKPAQSTADVLENAG